jgi:hypothetical protein
MGSEGRNSQSQRFGFKIREKITQLFPRREIYSLFEVSYCFLASIKKYHRRDSRGMSRKSMAGPFPGLGWLVE